MFKNTLEKWPHVVNKTIEQIRIACPTPLLCTTPATKHCSLVLWPSVLLLRLQNLVVKDPETVKTGQRNTSVALRVTGHTFLPLCQEYE